MGQGGPALTWHGRELTSVFDLLLGHDESDLTAALGFTLARCPNFLRCLVKRVLPTDEGAATAIRLETPDKLGRTDLEIDVGSQLVIIEAKRGWRLPSKSQLGAYAPRIRANGAGVLVSLSDATEQWAAQVLPDAIDGVRLLHLPWASVHQDLEASRRAV